MSNRHLDTHAFYVQVVACVIYIYPNIYASYAQDP